MPVDAVDIPTEDPTDEPEVRKGWSTGRVVLVAVVAGMVAMWIYVLYLAFGPGRQPPADRLDDPAFAEAGEARCAAALEEVEALPVASESHTATERADVLDDANDAYRAMVDDMEADLELAPAGDQRRRATEWLEDWRTLLGDRQAYAGALRLDPDARLLISEKGDTGRHITGWIDEFAMANKMDSCVTPVDV